MGSSIAVLGAGAIGSSVAADLISAGLDVTVIDQWAEHVEAMRANQLRVTMPDKELVVDANAHHLSDVASLKPTFDIVFVCVKSYDTKWMAQFIEPHLADDGVLVGIQNSMNDDAHAEIVGRDRTMGCAIELSAEVFTPGVVQRNTTNAGTWLAVGELDGRITGRAEYIASLLSNVAAAEVTSNIYGTKWTKLVANSMTMGPFGLFGLNSQEAARLPGMSDVSVALGVESVEVGKALGYQLVPVFGLTAEDFDGDLREVLGRAQQTLLTHIGGNARNAVVQDHLKGRRSEFEFISGLVTRMGLKVGIETPHNDAVVEIARWIDRGEVEMGPENFDRLLGLISEV